ncbi:MraY family glycosyltransferase [Noviherbaspirillum sedimenti]|uniref:Glycosyl transferase 4 family protein n=1 Tax=Noviherbaspirillum sedimenti TaxID=2320865 RepID=A0A3A3G464_9BURK|nr:glycosyltransferase [Noviherbaspirillum sedimenti]RJG01292.1 glycosyl transferase 4 family protein [Noviherbaspirillum sedimenti]
MTSNVGWISRTLENAVVGLADAGMLMTFWVALIASLTVSVLIVFTERWHGRYSFDNDFHGVQKVHKNPVPRTGGIALMTGILVASVFGIFGYSSGVPQVNESGIFKLLLAATPALLAGLIEDMTKNVSVKMRLIATFASAILAAWLLGAHLPRLDFWGLDGVLHLIPVSLAITAFAVAGVTNSINIVDGFNGVAGGAIVVVLAGMGFLSWQAGDAFVTQLALAGIGTTLGFLILNYPTGRLFMGDGGAYLLGFWAAEVAVLTIVRNPQINTWQVLAIFAYPVIEVVFSMYRRKIVRRAAVGAPDRLHLHSLFYRRLACQKIPRTTEYPWIRNASVAWFVSLWMGIATFLAISIGNTISVAVALVLIQSLAYMAVYARLIRGHWGRCLNPVVIFGWRSEPRSRPI